MRSFALAALTFLTLGVFSFAAPTPSRNDGAIVDIKADVDADVSILKRADSDDDKCVESILQGVIDVVDEVIVEITKIEVELTVEILDPILKKVKRVIVIAIKDVKALVHLDTNSILKTVTGLLDLHGLAKLLCDVLTCVLKLVQLVLKIVSSVVKGDILPLLCEILNLVGELLTCVLDLDLGIVGSIVGLVLNLLDKVLLKIIVDLDITILINLLGVDC